MKELTKGGNRMSEDMAAYEAALKEMKQDCDTCSRPGIGTQVCPMPKLDIDTCLNNASRPFWRPWQVAGTVNRELDELITASSSRSREDDQPYTDTQVLIREECDIIKYVLTEKNRKYGDSAINPARIFSKADPLEQINVRMDDKLSRIRSAQEDDTEDPELDLIGYLILKRVAKRVKGVGSNEHKN
jgi:hypothetical protein